MKDHPVLVIKREVFESSGIFQGISFDVDRYLKAFFSPLAPSFLERSKAEEDPNYKQIIPYILLKYKDNYFSYVRGSEGDEKRLVGHRALGLGGHVNPIDMSTNFYNAYLSAVKREVEEEVYVNANYSDSIVALINDDSNAVGQVHIGIVHLWELEAPMVKARESLIRDIRFMNAEEIEKEIETFETWSQLCFDYIIKGKDNDRDTGESYITS